MNRTEDRVKKLKELRDKGFIDQVEFDTQLERILADGGDADANRPSRGFDASGARDRLMSLISSKRGKLICAAVAVAVVALIAVPIFSGNGGDGGSRSASNRACEVGQKIDEAEYSFTVNSYELLPEGEGDGISDDTLEANDSRELHIDLSFESKSDSSWNDMGFGVQVPTIVINNGGDYTSSSSQQSSTASQPHGKGSETLIFEIPNSVASDIETMEFSLYLNGNPKDGSGGEWSAKKTDKGFEYSMSSANEERGYSFKLK